MHKLYELQKVVHKSAHVKAKLDIKAPGKINTKEAKNGPMECIEPPLEICIKRAYHKKIKIKNKYKQKKKKKENNQSNVHNFSVTGGMRNIHRHRTPNTINNNCADFHCHQWW